MISSNEFEYEIVASEQHKAIGPGGVPVQGLVVENTALNRKLPLAVEVPFSFDAERVAWEAGRKLEGADKSAFVFGAVRSGLQLGIISQTDPRQFRVGEEVSLPVVIYNSSKESVRFVLWSPQQLLTIVDADNRPVPLIWHEPSFESLPTFISLAPGESFRSKYGLSLKPESKRSGALGPWWESLRPAAYKVHVSLPLDIVPTKEPRPKQATQLLLWSAQTQLLTSGDPDDEPGKN